MKNYKLALVLALSMAIYGTNNVYAATSEEIDAEIAEQEKILQELNSKRDKAKTDALSDKINNLQDELKILKEHNNNNAAQGAIDSMTKQINDLHQELLVQQKTQNRLTEAIEKIEKLLNSQTDADSYINGSTNRLVNPAPNKSISYTQDAQNSQGNSTMMFKYAPNQLYKIYCRVGYLTDISLKKGEKISFVGGGDTSAWAINSTTVDGVPHIYIKPTVDTSSTNLIITTDKRSYQLIVNTSNWYNPMVTWSYGIEEKASLLKQQEKDAKTITEELNTTSMEHLYFDYEIKTKGSASSNKPSMVFDDGNKTIIKFKSMPKRLPALFIREKGHKSVSLANFKAKDNCYILDRVVNRAELRFGDTDIITIERR